MKIKALSRPIHQCFQSLKTSRGQSLVEMALFFPILLMIIAGIVEVGHTLNTYLVVANATREGTRYGVTVGDSTGDDQTITQTIVETMEHKGMEVTDENTCMWLVRFETNDQDPTGFDQWDARHVYGHFCSLPADFPSRMLNEVGPNTSALVAWTYYEQEAMLPIPFLSTLGESIPIAPYTAMRMEVSGDVPSRTGGCCVYPITVHRECLEGKEIGDPVLDIEEGVDSGQFGWLRWKGDEQMCQGEDPNPASANILAGSLAYPGNSCTCDDSVVPECWKGYQNPDDSDEDTDCDDPDDDQEINVGDWVWGFTGAIGSVTPELDEHIEYGRTLQIIVWDEEVRCPDGKGPDECAHGTNLQYKVYGFALVKLLEYSTGKKTISAIFLGWVDYCGQNPESLGPAVTSPV